MRMRACRVLVAVGLLGCSAASPGADAGTDAAVSAVDSARADSGQACTADASEGAMCGNGVCDVTETCLTCVPDCGCCGATNP